MYVVCLSQYFPSRNRLSLPWKLCSRSLILYAWIGSCLFPYSHRQSVDGSYIYGTWREIRADKLVANHPSPQLPSSTGCAQRWVEIVDQSTAATSVPRAAWPPGLFTGARNPLGLKRRLCFLCATQLTLHRSRQRVMEAAGLGKWSGRIYGRRCGGFISQFSLVKWKRNRPGWLISVIQVGVSYT